MSESMVERVARILEPQAWRALGLADTLAYANRRTSSLRKARAAIEEMRDPTDAMTVAMEDARDQDGHTHLEMAWQLAIDAALNEQVAG